MPNRALIGSERQPIRGARSVGKADPAERLEVSVVLRHRASDSLKDRVAKLAAGERPDRHLSREEFARQFGADPADITAVRQFANAHALVVVEEDAADRRPFRYGYPVQQRVRGRSGDLRASGWHISWENRVGPFARRAAWRRHGGTRPR
jgi:Pro-kumamolisin, activation domain